MQKEQSAFLTAFYRDWLSWVESGAHNGAPYFVHKGLCQASLVFQELNNINTDYVSLVDEMAKQFHSAGLNYRLPFDESLKTYSHDYSKYKNQKRLQWVKDHAALGNGMIKPK